MVGVSELKMDSPATSDTQSPMFNVLEFLESQPIDGQAQSTLCSGLPSEIRNSIFQYALSEYLTAQPKNTIPDLAVRYDHEPGAPPALTGKPAERTPFQSFWSYDHVRTPARGYDWLRPDNQEPTATCTALLSTCRKIYLETHAMPLMLKEHRLYCHRGPGGSGKAAQGVLDVFEKRLGGPASLPGLRSRDMIRSLRIFPQFFWLEDTNSDYHFWDLATRTPYLRSVEHLRLTLRRGDWWYWERNAPLRINPFRGGDMMREDMQIPDGNPPFNPRSWGRALKHLPKLKTLRIDFETSEDKREELEAIVAWAVKWRFPLTDGRYLSTKGHKVEKMSWRGRAYHWSDQCALCGSSPLRANCEKCIERERFVACGLGPRLYVWTLTWKSTTEDPFVHSMPLPFGDYSWDEGQ